MPERSGKVLILEEGHIVSVRKIVRELCNTLGFSATDVTRVVTASSELARNIFKYAVQGEMRWRFVDDDDCAGLELIFEDRGPGIPNIPLAMSAGYSTSRGLGLGLSGAARLMDELDIWSEPGKGTRVTVRKCLKHVRQDALESVRV